jgi:hypothetical protein
VTVKYGYTSRLSCFWTLKSMKDGWMKLDRNAVFTVVGLAFGVVMLGVAFVSARGTSEAARYPEGLIAITPAAGAQTSKQSELLVDLDVGYTGQLSLDGNLIPLDQLQYDANNYGLVYPCRATSVAPADPGETRKPDANAWPACSISASDKLNLPNGNVQATVEFWKVGDKKNTLRQFTWFFRTY